MEKLTATEEEVMRIIWRMNGGPVKEMLSQMGEPRPPYTTLASVVKNLEKKGYVASQAQGVVRYYTPLIAEEEYKRSFLKGFVGNYFANSFKEMVSFFVKDEKISKQELREIMEMIEKGEKK